MSSSILTTIFTNLSNLSPQKQPSQPDLHLGLYQPLQAHHADRSLLHSLSTTDSDQARSIFVTLHMLFPHELLPALDLLDRCLVTKLIFRPLPTKAFPPPKTAGGAESSINVSESDQLATSKHPDMEIFYIQSASATDRASTSNYRARHATPSASSTYYEVRLDSWNCSCPAFSVSAFQCLGLDASSPSDEPQHVGPTILDEHPSPRDTDWAFGGAATLDMGRAPSCKHILAALLAKAAPELFKNEFKERTVSMEEAVAWGSGWGDFSGG